MRRWDPAPSWVTLNPMATYRELLVGATQTPSGTGNQAPVPTQADLVASVWDPLPLADKQAVLSTFWKDLSWGKAPLEAREAMGLEPIPDTIPDDAKPSFAGGWWDPLVLGRGIIGRLLRYVASQNPAAYWEAKEQGKLREWLLRQLPAMQARFIEAEVPRLSRLAEETLRQARTAALRLQQTLQDIDIRAPIELDASFTMPGEVELPEVPEPFQPRGPIDEPQTRWQLIMDRWVRPYFLPHAWPKVAQLLGAYVREGIDTRSLAMNWAVMDALRRMAPLIEPEDVTSEGRYFLLALWPEEYGHLR